MVPGLYHRFFLVVDHYFHVQIEIFFGVEIDQAPRLAN